MTQTMIMVAVEDAHEAQKLGHILDSEGFQVLNVSDFNENSLNKVTDSNPDLIIIDVVFNHDWPFIGAIEQLKSKNYPIGIFTGKGRDASLITVKKLRVNHYFDLVVTGDDVENHKPSPGGILKFVNQFKLKPDRVLMIGDSVSDVKASRDAGIKIASVLWDSYGKEEVKTLSCDYYFHSVQELREFLLGTN